MLGSPMLGLARQAFVRLCDPRALSQIFVGVGGHGKKRAKQSGSEKGFEVAWNALVKGMH